MGKQPRQAEQQELPFVPLFFRTAKVLTDRMLEGSADAVMSMTLAHATALNYLAANAQVTGSELARHLNVTKQATSELVTGLESAGIIRRAPHPADRRAHVLLLTSEGEALLAESHRRWYQIQDQWEALVGPERVALMRDAMKAFLTASDDPVIRDSGPSDGAPGSAQARPRTS